MSKLIQLNDIISNGISVNFSEDTFRNNQNFLKELDGQTLYDFLTTKSEAIFRNRGTTFTRWFDGKKDRYDKFCKYIENKTGITIPDEKAFTCNEEEKKTFLTEWDKNDNNRLNNLTNIFQTSGLCCA